VTKTLMICLRNPEKLDALLVDLSKTKVHVGNIEFSSSKLLGLNDELQVKAVQNAKKRAEAMAAPTGAKVGRALKIRDATEPGARNQSMDAYSSGAGVSVGNSATGALSVMHAVEVDFELLDPAAK
jgi:uncharacterized protein YggE